MSKNESMNERTEEKKSAWKGLVVLMMIEPTLTAFVSVNGTCNATSSSLTRTLVLQDLLFLLQFFLSFTIFSISIQVQK